MVSIRTFTALESLHTNTQLVRVGFFRICQSLLARPNSMEQEDVDRRARVRQRNIDFNQQLQEVCATFTTCRYDGGAVFSTPFSTSDVSTRDYFHPSAAGQAKLASVSWAAGYWGGP